MFPRILSADQVAGYSVCALCSLGGLWQEGGSVLQAAHSHSVYLPVADRDRFGYFLLSGTFLPGFRFLLSRPRPLRLCWFVLVLRRLRVCDREGGRILWWNNVCEHSLVAE